IRAPRSRTTGPPRSAAARSDHRRARQRHTARRHMDRRRYARTPRRTRPSAQNPLNQRTDLQNRDLAATLRPTPQCHNHAMNTATDHSAFDTAPFRARRERLIQRMQAAGGGVAVLATAPERTRNRDTTYPYRHDSYFHYLT